MLLRRGEMPGHYADYQTRSRRCEANQPCHGGHDSERDPRPAFPRVRRRVCHRGMLRRGGEVFASPPLVHGKRRIHLVHPGDHASADVNGIGKTSVLHHGQAFG